MARLPRDLEPGFFHVYAHCVWATDRFFRDDRDYLAFLRELARTTARTGWICVGYCLMGSHYHLIVWVDRDMLPRAMHALNFRYAMYFNKRHSMKGHVQGRRYGARRLSDDDEFLGGYKYMVNNPSEADLCDHPEEWRWSSYAAAIGLREPDSFVDSSHVLRCFPGPIESARAALRRYVAEQTHVRNRAWP